MSWKVTYYIDDFEFHLSEKWDYWDQKNTGGVAIDPENHQLDNPKYIEALKTACKIYPDVCKIQNFEDANFSSRGKDGYYLIRWDSLEVWWNVLLEQISIEVPEHLVDMVDKVRSGYYIKEHQAKTPPQPEKPKQSGYVYLLKQVNGEHYKIGRSKTPEKRIKTMGVKLPFPIETICVIKSVDMIDLELTLHDEFAHKRVDGEWFALNADDIDYLKSLAEGE